MGVTGSIPVRSTFTTKGFTIPTHSNYVVFIFYLTLAKHLPNTLAN